MELNLLMAFVVYITFLVVAENLEIGKTMFPFFIQLFIACGYFSFHLAATSSHATAPISSLTFAFTGIAIWYVNPVTGEYISKDKAPINQPNQ